MDYQGIKINNKIIVVERTENELSLSNYTWRKTLSANQGYIVDIGNKKMLESALSWAKWSQYLIPWKQDMTEEEKKARLDSYAQYEGIINEYDNGNFELTLDESADSSSQGGKLSFWNCILKAPDGKQFLIGINGELLLHLLKSNTFVNGKCESKVWLGRVKGNQVGAFTENMKEFEQAKVDEKTRTTKKTKAYNVGDIVETLNGDKEVYLGEFYVYCKKYVRTNYHWSHWSNLDKTEELYVLLKEPIKMHAYVNTYITSEEDFKNNMEDMEDWENWKTYGIGLKSKKVERLVTGKLPEKDSINTLYLNYFYSAVDNYGNNITNIKIKPRTEIGESYPFDHLFENIPVRRCGKLDKQLIKDDFNKALTYYNNYYNNKFSNSFYERKVERCIVNEEDYGDINLNDWEEYPLNYFYNYKKYLIEEQK